MSWRVSCTQQPTSRFGPGAQLAWHREQRKIRTWRKWTEHAQDKGHDIVSFDFGLFDNNTAGEKTAPYLCMEDHVSGVVSHKQ